MLLRPLRRPAFYVLWGLCTLYALAPAVDLATPGALLRGGLFLVALAGGGLAWLLTMVALLWRERLSLGRRRAVVLGLLALGVALAFLWGVGLARTRDALVARSEEHIEVRRMGTVSEGEVREVVAGVEGALEALSREWGVPLDGVRLTLLVHPDADALRRYTGLPEWAGGMTLCYGDSPRVHLAVGAVPGARGVSLPAPAHEAVHALVCAVWGSRAFTALPLWFHEGVATEFSARGISRLTERVMLRLQLWLNGGRIPPAEEFCTRAYLSSGEDPALFYTASLEFVRYLVARSGDRMVPRVMEAVERGVPFGKALSSVAGGSCPTLFEAWRASF